jgi:hypothetical protein
MLAQEGGVAFIDRLDARDRGFGIGEALHGNGLRFDHAPSFRSGRSLA